ncbi:MAG TPA: hypothetical protein VGA13_10770 [Acidimicrobiales bacterium]
MCDTMVRVAADGVLFAKSSDRDPNEAQVLEWHAGARHARGSTVCCTYVEVAQAPSTLACVLSRPFWMWGAEMGVNEAGVAIGNEAVFTTTPVSDRGLTGMDLVRLGLERGHSAPAAVEAMVALLEEYGQGGGCGHEDRSFSYHSSFLVADSGTAYVVETAGPRWATEQVQGGGRSISNGLTIPSFAAEHADHSVEEVNACGARRAATQEGVEAARGEANLMAVLRLHEGGGAGPTYHPLNGGMGAPCMHAGGGVVNSQTTGSLVASLVAGRQPVIWATGTAAPCTSLFKPVAVGDAAGVGPPPTDIDDGRSLWWRHERLHRSVMRDPDRLLPLFVPERDAVEAAWLASPPADAEARAEAWAEADRLLAGWTEQVAAAASALPIDVRPEAVREYWSLRNERAGMPAPAVT